MLDVAIEKVLTQVLDPYLNGIHVGSIRNGIFKGHLELTDLSLKPEVLALAGLEGYTIREGTVRLIRICIPWNSLATGKVKVIVSGVHMAVEQVEDGRDPEEIVASMREMKRKAVEIRVGQVRDLLEQRKKAAQQMEGEDEGFGMKVVRKFINNIKVEVSDVQVSFASPILGVAAGVGLPQLQVLSTDEDFEVPDEDATVSIEGSAMYKLVHVRGFDVKLCAGGACGLDSLQDAPSAFGPLDTRVTFAHVPVKEQIQLGLFIGDNKVTLLRSQTKHLVGVPPVLEAQLAKQRAMLVKPQLEKAILADPNKAKEEYGRLFSRKLAGSRGVADSEAPALTSEEAARLQALEDVLPVQLLAAQHCSAEDAVEEAVADPAAAECGPFAFLRRFACCAHTTDRSSVRFDALRDAAQFESVEAPQKVALQATFGKLSLELVDDHGADAESRQALSVCLHKTNVGFRLASGTDHRGTNSVEFRLDGCMDGIGAEHAGKDVVKVERTSGSEFAGAAQWVVEQKLETDHNLLSLSFDSNPLQISFYPSMVGQLLDFALPFEKDGSPSPKSFIEEIEEIEEAAAAAEDVTLQWLETANPEKAQEIADIVYDRVPDRMDIRLNLSGPTVRLPVFNLGTVELSLGQLRLATPVPSALSGIKMTAKLSNASLRTVSASGESIDVIKPFPVCLDLNHEETTDEVKADLKVSIGRLDLCAAPQALQILAAAPGVLEELQPPPAPDAAPPEPAATLRSSLQGEEGAERPADERLAKLSKFAKEAGDKSSAVDAATKRAQEVAGKQLLVDVTAQIAGVGVTLTDCVVSVARVQLQFLEPISLHAEMSMMGELNHAHVDVDNVALDAEALNPRNGAWEPLLEPFHFGADVDVAAAGDDGELATRVSCAGHTPLLINAALPSVHRLNGLVPMITSMLEPPKGDDSHDKAAGRYRVINLFDQELELVFAPSCDDATTRIKPSTSDSGSIEQKIITLARTVAVKLPGGQCSEPLRLDQGGVVDIPGSEATAELLAPDPSRRLLLLGTPLRVHNQTDIALEVRFHGAGHEVVPCSSASTPVCNAAWIGFPLPRHALENHLPLAQEPRSVPEGSVLLPPNSICAVPPRALQRAEGAGGPQARVSVRPLDLDMDYSAETEVGGDASGLSTLSCMATSSSQRLPTLLTIDGKGNSGDRASTSMKDRVFGSCGAGGARAAEPQRRGRPSCSHVHLACERRPHGGPAADGDAQPGAAALTLKPAMSLLNALPLGNLSLAYVAGKTDSASGGWREVQVNSMTCHNLYQFPVGALGEGISIRARLDANAPWSQAAFFGAEALQKHGAVKTLDARQSKDGAAAGLSVESLGGLKLRLLCPNYFVHRLALGDGARLELRHKGALLPSARQVTLLPSKVDDNTCDLVLTSDGDKASHGLPLDGSFHMTTKKGPRVLCTQFEDVAPSSLLGAQSRVFTLRAHTVLTNSSPDDMELQPADGAAVIRLPSGTSTEHHFRCESGKSPETTVRIRKVGAANGEWSMPIRCSESAAGSTPFSVPGGTSGPDVWTVEVAPQAGAMSISFKHSSELVAINRSKRKQVPMVVRLDGDADNASVTVQPGEEMPLGWAKPRQGSEKRPMSIEAEGVKCSIEDVRRRARRVLGAKQLVVTVSRVGSRTLVVLDDLTSRTSAASEAAEGSTLHLDLRLDEIGMSVVGRPQPLGRAHELFFFHIGGIRLDYNQNMSLDSAQVDLVISELQGACQLPDRSDGQESPNHGMGQVSMAKRKPAVILANRGQDGAAFLHVSLQQEAVSCPDLVLSAANVSLDKLDLSVDDAWLGALQDWLSEALPQDSLDLGTPFDQVATVAGRALSGGYTPPPVPLVMSAEVLQLSAVNLTVWANIPLSMLDFLPAPARGALAVLSMSGHFTLNGAGVNLSAKDIPPYSGPVDMYALQLVRSYGWGLMRVVAELLGKSSLLNVPAAPFQIAGSAVAALAGGAGQVLGAGTSALQGVIGEKQRSDKNIDNVGDGVMQAGGALARGVGGLADIVLKPIEGAKEGGVKGFAKGVGTGIAGAIVKPIAAVGEAAGDLTSGLSSSAKPTSKAAKRQKGLHRYREPRLLFSKHGEMRLWSEQEAEVPRQLGWEVTRGVKEVVYLSTEGTLALVLLIFPDKLLLAKIAVQTASETPSDAVPEQDQEETSLAEEFKSALRPISTLDGLADLVGGRRPSQRSHGSHGSHEGEHANLSALLRGLPLGDLRSAELQEAAGGSDAAVAARSLVLEDRSGAATQLSLGGGAGCPTTNAEVREALLSGLRAAAASGAAADAAAGAGAEPLAAWAPLGAALRSWGLAARLTGKSEASSRVLEVYEVQRWQRLASEWRVPFLPIDSGLSWRWVNAQGSRHPQIDRSVQKKESASSETPPCDLSGFKPASDWKMEQGDGTDDEGWTYSLKWSGGGWDSAPGMVKALRRRRWTRLYE